MVKEKLQEANEAPEMVDHKLTQEDFDKNPDLQKEGLKIGDVIQVPLPAKESSSDDKKENEEEKEEVESVHAESAKKLFKSHPNVDEFHFTEDGFAFKEKHHAENHSKVKKHKKPIVSIKREA